MKKKMKAGLVVAIAAVMMLSSYAAALSQDEIAGLMLNASEVDTYKFDMNMNMTTEMLMGNETNATEPMVMVMVGNGSGVVDNINKSMMMVMSTCMNMSGIMEANTSVNTNGNLSENVSLDMPEPICMETEMYIINNTMYTKMDMSTIVQNFSFWLKSEMTEEDWVSEDLLGQQMELLNYSNVTLLDDEEVNGVDCYVLKIVPDTEKFWEIMVNQSIMDQLGPSAEMQNTSDVLNQSLSNTTITEWIAKDTKFVMKAVAAMDMTMSPDTEEEANVAMDYTMTFYDYNVPVTIVLPPEAESAVDISDMLGMLPGMNETDILPGGNETDSLPGGNETEKQP
ncbi:hypothetical protein C5S29_04100 [ANME-1 cluster archaeon GoMg3.2]|nr:hypothetical protein [ANME-1 cluster archaeon GoMg3.2]